MFKYFRIYQGRYVRQLAYILDNRSVIEEKIRNNGIADDGLDD